MAAELKIWRVSGLNFIWVLYYDALSTLNTYQWVKQVFDARDYFWRLTE